MTKSFYNTVYQEGHPSKYGVSDKCISGRTDVLQNATKAWLESTGLAVKVDATILEIGCGMSYFKVDPIVQTIFHRI